MTCAQTALLPPVAVGEHLLNFFCDLQSDKMLGALATCCTWLELSCNPPTQLAGASVQQCYQWADAKTREFEQALEDTTFRAKALARLQKEFFDVHGFAPLRWAFVEHFGS